LSYRRTRTPSIVAFFQHKLKTTTARAHPRHITGAELVVLASSILSWRTRPGCNGFGFRPPHLIGSPHCPVSLLRIATSQSSQFPTRDSPAHRHAGQQTTGASLPTVPAADILVVHSPMMISTHPAVASSTWLMSLSLGAGVVPRFSSAST
jgi:hypothetical protein